MLGPDESAYYRRLTHRRRQESFLMGRLVGKGALAEWSGGAALERIEIQRGVFEQPVVRGDVSVGAAVSLSHDAAWAVGLAFLDAHPMAVDVETVQGTEDGNRLGTIESQLSPLELEWARRPGIDSALISTAIWTAKEAVSKVIGCGLTAPVSWMNLKRFEPVSAGLWRGEFAGLAQYQALSWLIGRTAMTLVLPRNSSLRSTAEVAGVFCPRD